MTFKFREYALNKMLATGMLKINKPGIVTYSNSGFLGSRNFKTRVIYLLEETYVSLYNDTLKKIGKVRADELWYKIGKDVAMRYLLNFKGMDKSSKNLEKIIRYFSIIFSSMGIPVFNEISVDSKKLKFLFSGTVPPICAVTKSYSYVSGMVSGMMSFILNKNIEAKSYISDDNKIIVFVDNLFEEKHFQCEKIFSEIVFHKPNLEKEKCLFSGLSSFVDFFKFKIIELDDDGFKLHGKNLIPQEVGTPGIFSNNYSKIGEGDLFEKSILKSSEKICSEFFSCHKTTEKKVRVIRNICSALGLGEIYFTQGKNRVTVNLLNPFFTKGNPSFVPLFFSGILTAMYSEKIKLESKTDVKFEYIFEQ